MTDATPYLEVYDSSGESRSSCWETLFQASQRSFRPSIIRFHCPRTNNGRQQLSLVGGFDNDTIVWLIRFEIKSIFNETN